MMRLWNCARMHSTQANTSVSSKAMAACGRWMEKLIRKKVFTDDDLDRSELRRCLSTLELTGLGLGSTLGVGAYVLSGQVARESAGPAVLLSFLVAGLAAGLAGLCYAEFASRVPRAGSAYTYSYVTVGELMAFVIGWNITLEYVIGVASVARAISAYVDYLTGNSIQEGFQRYMPVSVPGLSAYPDFLASSLILVSTGIVALGVKESTRVNSVLSCINLVVLLVIIICGFIKADIHNWQLFGDELPESGAGNGGFAPFGVSGIVAGAATCFFAFVGFDSIASMGEEAEDSRWSVPVSMGVTLAINMVCFCGVAAVVTLLVPYFIMDIHAPIVFAFDHVGWTPAMYVISVGALCGMASSMMGGVFPMARVVYAMSSDGLIFRCLSTVSPRFRTPLVGTVAGGSFAAVMALLFDLRELIEMQSIGTLLAFGLVAVCVLILRYETDETLAGRRRGAQAAASDGTTSPGSGFKLARLVSPGSSTPTEESAWVAKICIAVMCVSLSAWAAVVKVFFEQARGRLSEGAIVMATTLGVTTLTSVFFISRQPQNPLRLRFKVRMVPVLPALTCVVNVCLMSRLSAITWLRFVVWLVIGFCAYFFYGLRHSSLNVPTEERLKLTATDERTYTESCTDQSSSKRRQYNTAGDVAASHGDSNGQ